MVGLFRLLCVMKNPSRRLPSARGGLCVLLLASVSAVTPATGAAGTAVSNSRCFESAATIVGTPGADVIVGSPHRDVISAKGGDDVVRGAGGNDLICGDAGADVVRGGAGHDRLFETCNCLGVIPRQDLHDDGSVFGGPGNDWVVGSHGANLLSGGSRRDVLMGGMGDDVLDGGWGRDLAHFGGTYDNYYLAAWSVLKFALSHSVTVDLSQGMASGQGYDQLVDIENVVGSDRGDTLIGDVWPNKLWGVGGNDTLRGAGGGDVVNGGPFIDRCDDQPGHRRWDCELPD